MARAAALLILAALAILLALACTLGSSPATPSAAASPFGASHRVAIAHVGSIERNLTSASSGGLRRVACAGGSAAACWVARS